MTVLGQLTNIFLSIFGITTRIDFCQLTNLVSVFDLAIIICRKRRPLTSILVSWVSLACVFDLAH